MDVQQTVSAARREQIVSMRGAGLNYAEIGRRLHVTRERVRQIANGETIAKKKRARNNPNGLLTIAEAAELLNVHTNTVRRWSNKGILETYIVGPRNDRRFKRRDVKKLLRKKSLISQAMS